MVTPELAHDNADLDSLAPIPQPLTLSTTLPELRATVCQHLGVPTGDDRLPELDCNCSAARQIDTNAVLNERGAGDSDALHTLVVIYEDNKVAVIPTQEPTLASIQRAAREQLQDKATGRLLCAIGGVEDLSVSNVSTGRYLKLPVLAVCSRQSHHRQNEAAANDSDSDTGIDDWGLTIDLHTSECPIEVTVHNKDVALATTGLHDCAVNGVLTIFAVQCIYSTTDGKGSGTYLTQTCPP